MKFLVPQSVTKIENTKMDLELRITNISIRIQWLPTLFELINQRFVILMAEIFTPER